MRRFIFGLFLGLLVVTTLAYAQPFPTSVQLAINQLTTGVTPFTNLRNTASAYINWGATSGSSGYGLRDNGGTIEAKNSGGSWLALPTSSTLPTNSSYILETADVNLPNAFALGALTNGLLVNTTTTGVPSIYAGTSCVNQFPRSLSSLGVATCATVTLTTDVTGILPVANGGTGLASGTSGGVLAYTASGTLASSAALTANAIVLGGGAGVVPTVLGSLGTATTLLHGNAAGAPTFGAVVLTTDVSGILPAANGGTGNGFFAVSGPTTATKTFTFPDANATVLTSNTAVTAAQGGTGIASYTTGDILYASAATTLSKLADTSTGNALISGGVGVAPSWGKIGLTTHVSGTLGVTNGGTGFAAYTTGDLLYANSGTTLARLADVATGQVLVSGGVGVAPAWSTTAQVSTVKVGTALTFSSTTPTIGSGFGTGAAFLTGATSVAFHLNVGTTPGSSGVVTLPAASHDWNCAVHNLTSSAAHRNADTFMTASSSTSVTLEQQTTGTRAAVNWMDNDILEATCAAW